MKNKMFVAMILVLLNFFAVINVNAEEGLNNFKKVNFYDNNTFLDVGENEWFSSAVQFVYETGLMSGRENNLFDPAGNMTVAEVVALASRLNNIYFDKNVVFEKSEAWYAPYAQYAIENNITSGDYDYRRYNSLATRSGFVSIMVNALPAKEYNEINKINNGDISDIALTYDFADDAYLLYRAGIISGTDENGNFSPYSYIRRSDVAAIVARIIDPAQRIQSNFTPINMHRIEIGRFAHYGHVSFAKYNDIECGYAYEMVDDVGYFNHLGGPWDISYSLGEMVPYDHNRDFISQIFYDIRTVESNNPFLKQLIYFDSSSDDAKTFKMIEKNDDQYISYNEILSYVEIEYKGRKFEGITAEDYLREGLSDDKTGIWKGVRFYCNHIGSTWVYVNYNLNDLAAYFDLSRRFYIDNIGIGEDVEPAIRIVD